MLEVIKQEKLEIIINVIHASQKCNRIWGPEYLLMDSRTLMGSIEGEEYKNVISIFENIWNMYEYGIFAKFGA
jgi:hypothetical protein